MFQTASELGERPSQATMAAPEPGGPAADAALVQRLLRGEAAAWRNFMAEYDPVIRTAIWKTLGRFASQISSDDREEVRAVLLTSLLKDDMRKLRQYDAQRGVRLKTWISMLAVHAAWDHLRHLARAPLAKPNTCAERLATSAPAACASFGAKQLLQAVAFKVATFTRRDREFLRRMFLEDATPEEIATSMRISPRTVYTKKHKLTVRLKRALGAFDDWA